MEEACTRLIDGELSYLPFILSSIQGQLGQLSFSCSKALVNALVGILHAEGETLRRGSTSKKDLVIQKKYSIPSEESCAALAILYYIGCRRAPEGVVARGILQDYGLCRCREMSLDAYFLLPHKQRYYVVNMVSILMSVFGCSVEDLLYVPSNILTFQEGSLSGELGAAPATGSSSEAPITNGTSRDLPVPVAGHRFRQMPAVAPVVPYASNPLFDESVQIPGGVLLPTQSPGPVVEFLMFFGLGCVPRVPHTDVYYTLKTAGDPKQATAGCQSPSPKSTLPFQHPLVLGTCSSVSKEECNAESLLNPTLARYLEFGKLHSWGEARFNAQGDLKFNPSEALAKRTKASSSSVEIFTYLPCEASTPDSVLQTACGTLTSYLLTRSGEVYSCGKADDGQLGVGKCRAASQETGASHFQKVIFQGDDRVMAVSAGPVCAAALSTRHTVYCWGQNVYGQCLTPLDVESVITPIRFRTGKVKPLEVRYGQFFGIIVFEDGVVGTWGVASMLGSLVDPNELQPSLADDKAPSVRHVKIIPGLTNCKVRHVRAGPHHAMLITEKGEVLTWGNGSDGQLGHGCDSDETSPRLVDALLPHIIVDGECGVAHTAVVTVSGAVYVFGSNAHGQLGLRGSPYCRLPVLLHLPLPATGVACGQESICVLLATGDTMVTGSLRTCGVGLGYGSRIVAPTRILQNHITLSLSCGTTHAMALTLSRETALTRVGNASIDELSKIQSIVVRSGVRSVVSGVGFLVVASENGRVGSIGRGEDGQLGVGERMRPTIRGGVTVLTKFTLVQLPDEVIVQSLACGPDYVLAIDSRATVYGWGSNAYSHLCQPMAQKAIYAPVLIQAYNTPIVQVACGESFVVALSDSGNVFCHGVSEYCGMAASNGPSAKCNLISDIIALGGVFTEPDSGVVALPVKVPSLDNIITIAAGRQHAVALGEHDVVYAWGKGVFGNGGAAATHDCVRPVTVAMAQHIRKLGCGPWNCFAINDVGELYVWGGTRDRQCGVAPKVGTEVEMNPVAATPTLVARQVRDAAFAASFGVVVHEDGRVRVSGILRHNKQDYDLESFGAQPQPVFSMDADNHCPLFLPADLGAEHTDTKRGHRQTSGNSVTVVVDSPPRPLRPPAGLPDTAAHEREWISPLLSTHSFQSQPGSSESEKEVAPPSTNGRRCLPSLQSPLNQPPRIEAAGLQCYGGLEQVYVVMEKNRPDAAHIWEARRGLNLMRRYK